MSQGHIKHNEDPVLRNNPLEDKVDCQRGSDGKRNNSDDQRFSVMKWEECWIPSNSSKEMKEEMEFPGFIKVASSLDNKNRSIAVSKEGQSFLLEGKDKVEIECLRGHIVVDIDNVGDHYVDIEDNVGDHYKVLTKDGGLILLRDYFGHLSIVKQDVFSGQIITQVLVLKWGKKLIAVTSTGSVFEWEVDFDPHTTKKKPILLEDLSSEQVISIAVMSEEGCCVFVTAAGEVFTWYYENKHMDIGELRQGNWKDTPRRFEALAGVHAKQVACGCSHTAVRTEDGKVYTFGEGEMGELGHGDMTDRSVPTLVKALEGKDIVRVECSQVLSMALTSSGYAYTWGACMTSVPTLLHEMRDHNVVGIELNEIHFAVVVDSIPSAARSQLDMRALINDEEHSDVVFKVEGQCVYAKRDILMGRSEYFRAMFGSSMRESREREVEVSLCSMEMFLLVLEYLYTDVFSLVGKKCTVVVELYHVADMYQIEGLMMFCVGTLQERLSEDNVVEFLHTIDTFGSTCDALKTACLDIFNLKLLRERIGLNEPPLVLSDSLLLEIERMYSRELEDELNKV